MYNVTPSRPYTDGKVWQDSTIFSRSDLLAPTKVLDQAHDWI